MEILTQSNDQFNLSSDNYFDRESRANYFEMLEIAQQNLSIVDQKSEDIEEFKFDQV